MSGGRFERPRIVYIHTAIDRRVPPRAIPETNGASATFGPDTPIRSDPIRPRCAEAAMNYDYEVIAKMAADLSRQMQKLNNQLDRVIDKREELNDPQEQKGLAIALIEDLKWEEAARLCAEQAREQDKRTRLGDEESRIRGELEALRERLAAAANGDIQVSPDELPDED